MLKKFLYTILILLFFLVSPVFCADFKIAETKIDFSENIILLKGNTFSENLTYKVGFSENPTRAYIDLDNCIFTENKKTIELKNTPIKKIAIAQFSANPNKVRLVFYANNISDLQKIKLIKNGDSLVFKLKDFKYGLNQIPVTFSDVLPKQYKQSGSLPNEGIEFSKYILANVYQNQSGLLLSGIGTVKLSRPFILKNPIRIVFDMQNATAVSKSLYGEHTLANGDTIKIGQFNNDTLRFVVTTNNPVLYKSFISPDLQSLYITNINDMKGGVLPNTNIPSNIKRITTKQISPSVTYITMEFTSPIIHSPRRTYNKFLLDFLNVDFLINEPLAKTVSTAQFGGFIAQRMSETSNKLALLFSVNDDLKVETGLSQDGKILAIKLTSVLNPTSQITAATNNQPVIAKPKLPLTNKVIVVDAGHGGKDSGAISGKMYEKEPALKMSQMLQKNLEAQGAKVIMTRSDDTFITLQDRVSISNYENADLFISIHLNSSEKSNINGIETHWYKANSKDLAQYVQTELLKNVTATDRGLFKSMFYVINHTTAPAILVETGFISNQKERDELFQEKRQKATAKAISDGILEYYKKK